MRADVGVWAVRLQLALGLLACAARGQSALQVGAALSQPLELKAGAGRRLAAAAELSALVASDWGGASTFAARSASVAVPASGLLTLELPAYSVTTLWVPLA